MQRLQSPESATLYVVSTPIGNLDDITLRAIETLKQVDIVAAEDTRHTRHLLDHFAIATSLLAYHEHNEEKTARQLLSRLEQGQSIALVSDAGTPLIADPGYRLVKAVSEAGFAVVPIPGVSALITALSVAGLATDRFSFEGFLPAKEEARKKRLTSLLREPRTLVFYEAPHRIVASLQSMAEVLGAEREAALARELTKRFETVLRAPLGKLAQQVTSDANQQRGEMVLLLQGNTAQADADSEQVIETLTTLLQELPLKQAAGLASKLTGIKKNRLYQMALSITDKAKDNSGA
jgi:16S rRNA (cytidine1402-2'-O)-methyltransferase